MLNIESIQSSGNVSELIFQVLVFNGEGRLGVQHLQILTVPGHQLAVHGLQFEVWFELCCRCRGAGLSCCH